jgi:2-hydroxycyclohexanecarboxyl-CoA dehydrogenase
MSNRVAIVTGAAAGIGAACAIRLAADGATVGVLDLDAQRCADTVAAIKDAGGEAIALGADFAEPDQIEAALVAVRSAFGPVTILVNNAALPGYAPFLETKLEDWERILKANLTGTFLITQRVLPDMVAAGWGESPTLHLLQRRPAHRGRQPTRLQRAA